jgi:2,3-bisphosphoglycerate-dependent phosphoglycerate mutase
MLAGAGSAGVTKHTGVTRIIVIRHGETEWNVAARIQGHGDSPLTAEGIEQAGALARRLAREEFDLLISSDLGRAMQTARRIAELSPHEVIPDARFRERSFGAGEGLTYDEIDERYPGAFSRVREVDPDYAIPGGESRRQFHRRVAAAFESVVREHAGKRVVVVAHGGVLATFYRHIHDIGLEAPHAIPIANASYNALRHDGGVFAVEAWADTAHLPGAVPFEEN